MQKIGWLTLFFFCLGSFVFSQCPGLTVDITPAQTVYCGVPANIQLNNNSTGPRASTTTFEWYNGFSAFDTTVGTGSVTDIAPTVGTITYTVIAIDTSGCRDTVSFPVVVAPNPVAAFTFAPNNQCTGLPVVFTNTSTNTVAGTVYNWNFGDGNFSSQANPSHSYSPPGGTFTVTLTVTNPSGCTDQVSQSVTVLNPPVIGMSASPPTFCLAPGDTSTTHTVGFFNTTTGGVSYTWDYGDGSALFTTGSTAPHPHTYTSYGTFTVVLTATGANGCSSTDSITVIFDRLVAASFIVPLGQTAGCIPHDVTPINNSQNGTTFYWDFGDGTPIVVTNNQAAPTHTYNMPGNYIIRLTVENACGTSFSQFGTIIVQEPPTVNFVMATPPFCAPATVSFVNTSSGAIPFNNYTWEFGRAAGDSLAGIFTPPDQIYNQGLYSVTLTGRNGCGSSSFTLPLFVDSIPVANVLATPVEGCNPLPVVFLNTSLDPLDGHSWSLFGGLVNFSTYQIPPQVFPALLGNITTHNVNYTISNFCGSDDTTITITVHPEAAANFSVSNTPICVGDSVTFTDLSTGGVIGWDWDFGNGNNSTAQGPHTQTYNTPGFIPVTLTVDNGFCTGTFVQIVEVRPNPVANFAPVPDSACVPATIAFANSSTPGGLYNWTFGGGAAPPIGTGFTPPPVTYSIVGTQQVTLTVDLNGCFDSDTQSVVIMPLPVPAFTATPLDGCSPLTVSVTNSTPTIGGETWLWNFGDGTTSTLQNPPPHIFTNPGTTDLIRNITLTVTTEFGCVDSLSIPITIHPLPTANFTSPTGACVGETVTFTNTSTGATTFNWDFGDGNLSTLTSPTHSYGSTGNFTIELIAITGFGCRDTLTRTIQIDTIPSPNFAADTVCANTPTTFTDLSVGGVVSWAWDFGDGNFSSAQNPTHLYAGPGTYNVQLIATNGLGCPDSITLAVVVDPNPVAGFTAPAGACLGVTVNFTNTSTGATTFNWDFGDGNFSSLTNPTHNYANSGAFTIQLIATNTFGCPDTVTQVILVDTIPVPNFLADTVCIGTATSFTDLSTPPASVTAWSWDFGDGNFSSLQNPTNLYGAPGTYNVQLIPTNTAACSDSITLPVLVHPEPTAAFTAPAVCFGVTSVFTDASTGSPTAWVWDFGDGDFSALQNPTHTYAAPNTYAVTLIVFNAVGCSDTLTLNHIVHPVPTAVFVADTACFGTVTTFDATGSTGGPNLFSWNFGDGATDLTNNPTPVHSYGTPGTYTVTLIVGIAATGCADTTTVDVLVHPTPVAAFTADTVCLNAATTFLDQSTNAFPDQWAWDFGDATGSTLQNPTHVYATAGTFTVELIVTNTLGCADTITAPVLVHPIPTAGFLAPATCFGSPSVFTDTSLGTPTAWAWNFGDATTSNLQNPTHTYAAPGTYNVTLIVTNGVGCSDTLTAQHIVDPVPTAIFVADTVCLGGVTSFDATGSLGSPTTYAWTYGDGNVDNTNNPTPAHTYATAGTFSVRLIVGFAATGCTDTTFRDVVVHPVPVANFSADSVCIGFSTTFTDLSTGTPVAWSWTFGDGNVSSLQNPTHVYAAPGTYSVVLIATNVEGCPDTLTQDVIVHPDPVAGFTAAAGACLGQTVAFTNTSTGATTFNWDFGDGTFSTLTDPTHSYGGAGSFTVELIATTGFGCRDTFTQVILVDTIPVPNFVADTVCIGNPTTFTDLSTGFVVSWDWDFGDATTSVLQNPTHTYGTPGTFNVQLVATNSLGCPDSITVPVLVLPEPTAAFTAPAVCLGATSPFTDASTGPPVAWNWDFGDATNSVLQNPTHVYATADTFTVTLIVFNAVGCSDTLTAQHIVHPVPTAIFSADSVCFGNATTFDATSSIGAPDTYFWTFGDGATDNTNNATPTHTYGLAGTYTVTLVAGFGATGCTDTTTVDVVVHETPIAAFTADTVCLNGTTTFLDQSTNNFPNLWTWDFGDANGSSVQNPTHTYGTANTFNVQLVVENTFGCIDSITQPVIVEPLPTAGFTAATGACVGEVVPFTNTSTGATTYSWDFGDAVTSTLVNPTHSYGAGGTFTVTLIATTGFGCADTVTQTILVDTIPLPNFVADTVCIGNATSFTDLSSGGLTNWDWNFGDGNFSTLQNPTHAYATDGTFNVTLVVTDAPGCLDSITLPVLVNPIPTASFSAPDVCFNSPSVFTDNSSGTPISWDWAFGDGNFSSLQNPIHTYGAPGTYSVTLIVFSGVGCSDTITQSHTVFPIPTAVFTEDTVCFGLTTSFDASGSIGSPNTYQWTFGDGTFDLTNNPTPGHTYGVADTFTVTLIAGFGATGCTDTTTQDVIVLETPVAAFTADTVCLNGVTTFTDQSTNNFPNTWTWDFGDATGSTLQNPTHSYATANTFTVSLIVENTVGCIDTTTGPVIVEPLPVAGFTAQAQACVGEIVPFTNTSTGATNYLWDFGDGNFSALTNPTHAYGAGGVFTVELIAITGFGCRDTITQTITVDTIPIPNFVADTVCIGNVTTFTDLSTGAPVAWDWNFGDGNNSIVQNPTHPYGLPGTYNVTLTVTDGPGCLDSITLPVVVNPVPNAGFTAPDVCFSSPSVFTDNSTGIPIAWDWDFGDATGATVQNPTHTYATPGTYPVTLIVFSGVGCSDTITISHTVFPIPTAVFTADTVCFGTLTSFDATASLGSPNTFIWTYGDGNGDITNNPTPTHAYGVADTFTVTLIAGFGATGCTDTVTQDVIVLETPVAAFTADTVCLNGITTFTDQSINSLPNLWTWDFGDATGSSVQNPTHLYATANTFTVSLIVENTVGCIDTATEPVIVEPLPVASFTAQAQACVGETVPFTNTSTGATNYLWDFGDGNFSALTNPTHSYGAGGTFTIELIAITGFGCRDTITQTITVDTIPIPNFVADTVCIGNVTTFTDLSSGALVAWDWNFGDGNNSILQNPTHPYGLPGTYNVTLTVTDGPGCLDSITLPVVVNPVPTAAFTAPAVCFTSPSVFTDNSTGIPIAWDWDFGDANGSTLQNPTHTYGAPGTYNVTLIVFSGVGCSDTLTLTHTVHPIPTAVFSADTVCFGNATAFDATASIGSPNTFIWDFGDGNGDLTNNPTPTHAYGLADTFTVTLVAGFGGTGCTDTTTLDVVVLETPVAAFTADTVCLNGTTTFLDQSVNNLPNLWTWDFGDATGSTVQNPTHLYATANTFTVSLIVENTVGCIDTVTEPVIVEPLPVAGFTAQSGACVGDVVPFTNTSTGATNYNWDFGDGNFSTQVNPTHAYGTFGTFTVELIAITGFGCRDTFVQTIQVDTLPAPGFVADTVCIRNTTTFTDLSTGSVVSWDWDFGDGNSSVLQNPTHLYANPGTYNVRLAVTNTLGCVDSIIIPVLVHPEPTAGFTAPPACLTSPSIFTDTSLGTPTAWDWDFGDGNFSTLQSPTHVYAATGTYTVTLIVFSGVGCSDTVSAQHTVHPIPTAIFSRDTVCFGDSTFFDATASLGSPDTYFWDFGDGTTDISNSATLFHTYPSAGTYSVLFVAGFGTTGCTDTASLDVIVYETPVAAFAADTACLNVNTLFTDQSTNNFPNLWTWDFGDGNGSSVQNPSHVYLTPNTFAVQLIVENTFGCIDSITQPVIVNPLPVADFSADTVCLNLPTTFTDLSTSAVNWDWDFGDGNGSTASSPTHIYATSGTFTVTQIVFNVFGCSDTISRVVEVGPYPVADFSASTACFGYNTDFTDLSTGNLVSWAWDFGDTIGTDTVINPSYLYGDSGVFIASLIVANGFGCTDTATHPVTVLPIPVAGFTYPIVCARQVVQFQDTSLGLPSSWSWDFGDNSPLDTTQNPGHVYDPGGGYNVTLVAGNIFGCYDTLVSPVLVNTVPVPDFSETMVCQGDLTQFTNLSTDTSINVMSYAWVFGDGNNSFVQDPGYVYPDSGSYLVTLFTSNQHGCIDSITRPIYVAPVPEAAFVATTVCLGENTLFTDQSSAWVTSWSWDFGDGATSALQNPTHMFTTPGNHTVTLSVLTADGCTDTVVQNLNVQQRPEASFILSQFQCTGQDIDFVSTSLNNPAVWTWDFGDGGTSSLENPSYSYSAPGIYTVTLIASTPNSCSDTATQTIEVFENPVAEFAVDTVCLGAPTFFENLSTGGTSYYWTFGNMNNSSTAEEPGYIFFDTAGVFGVTLIATSPEGCADTVTHPALVADYPVAAFTSNPPIPSTVTTDNAFISFTNLSVGGLTHFWSFGDGVTSTDANPTHNYDEPGEYCVTLLVTGIGDCQDSVQTCTITVGTGIPDIPNLFTPNGDGTNDNFVIRNISEFPNNKLVVFNRWGNKVYEASRYNNEWGGENYKNGKILPDGGYFYVFSPGDGKKDVVGNVVLMK